MSTGEFLDSSELPQFTEESKQVLRNARDEAAKLGDSHIGTEHILLGLTINEDPTIENLGLDLLKTRDHVYFLLGRGGITMPAIKNEFIRGAEFTPRAKVVVGLSGDEARRMDYPYVLRAHLFLGLLREGQGIGAGVLESLGVSLPEARSKVLQSLESDPIFKAMRAISQLNLFLRNPSQDLSKKERVGVILEDALKLATSESKLS